MSQKNKIVKKRRRWDNGIIGRERVVVSKGRGNARRTYHVKTHYGTSRYVFTQNAKKEDIDSWIDDVLLGHKEYPFAKLEEKIDKILDEEE